MASENCVQLHFTEEERIIEEYLFRQKQKQLQYEHNKQTQRRDSRRANARRAGNS